MIYQFTDDCRLGIAEIDAEHQQLFSIINEAYSLMASEDIDIRITMKQLIEHLKAYASSHFAHEEEYMKQINDPELSTQKQQHSDFIARINSINLDRLDNDKLKSNMAELLDYLSRWLFRHIIGSDTLIGKFESPFAFTAKYETGIELVDNEHKRLFEIISEANDVIHAQLMHDKYDEIMRILSELKEYTQSHFMDEEKVMEDLKYPEIEAQKLAHQSFIDKLADIDIFALEDKQQEYLDDLIQFLLNWLTVHILSMDKKIGEYAEQRKNE